MAALHPPKILSSTIGLGLPTLLNKIDIIDANTLITTVVWPKLETPWTEGETTTAQEGYKWVTRWELNKPYLITTMFNEKNELIGIYCDICSPVTREGISFTCYDWYLDVWKKEGVKAILLDENELAIAVKHNFVSLAQSQQAKATAIFLMDLLNKDTKKD